MPVNRGQGQTTRWYQLCFVPTSADSSDDSDIESVVLTPSTPTTTSTTWQEHNPPEPSSPTPLPGPQIDLRLPPPPPPPHFLPLPPERPLQTWARAFDIGSQHAEYQPPSSSYVFEADQSECAQVPMDVINATSRVRISELNEIDKRSPCPICMEEFKVGDEEWRLPCIHAYHFECIQCWLKNNKTCPVCRLQMDGWEGHCGSHRMNHNGLVSEPEIPPPPPFINHDHSAWDYFSLSSPSLPGTENGAGDNSDEADYDSACDELGDSHEDGENVRTS